MAKQAAETRSEAGATFTPGPWVARRAATVEDTPGPWVARRAATVEERTPPIAADVHGPGGEFIADCGSHERSTANAALIAAAPDVFEALRITRDNLRTLNAARVDRGIVPFDPWLSVVEAALAKVGVTP